MTPQPNPSQGADAELEELLYVLGRKEFWNGFETSDEDTAREYSPDFEKAKAALLALERRLVREARIDELQRHDFQNSDDYDDRQYVQDRIAQLQAEGETNE
jgi:hypothetical protein